MVLDRCIHRWKVFVKFFSLILLPNSLPICMPNRSAMVCSRPVVMPNRMHPLPVNMQSLTCPKQIHSYAKCLDILQGQNLTSALYGLWMILLRYLIVQIWKPFYATSASARDKKTPLYTFTRHSLLNTIPRCARLVASTTHLNQLFPILFVAWIICSKRTLTSLMVWLMQRDSR